MIRNNSYQAIHLLQSTDLLLTVKTAIIIITSDLRRASHSQHPPFVCVLAAAVVSKNMYFLGIDLVGQLSMVSTLCYMFT